MALAEESSEEGVLEWAVPVSPELKSRQWIVGIGIGVGCLLGYWLVGWFGAVVGAIAIFASTAEVWLPIRFKLTELDASARIGLSNSVIRWENVERLLEDDGGVRLSPLKESSRLDAFRGVYLRFSGNRAAVLGKIAELTEKNGSSLDREADA